MNDLARVDPALRDFLGAFPIKEMDDVTLPVARAFAQEVRLGDEAIRVKYPQGIETRELNIAVGTRTMRVLVFQKVDSSANLCGALMYLHAGGYVTGAPELAADICREIASKHDCIVFAPAYALAPEVAYPGAIEDCYSLLTLIHSDAASFGVDPSRIAIAGESAGGGLAAGLALMARDKGELPLIGQLLIYPMLDNLTGIDAAGEPDPTLLWTPQSNRFAWEAVLGSAANDADAPYYASPSRCQVLTGLPTTAILIGELDLFLNESVSYAMRLVAAGVSTSLQVYRGCFHAFDMAPDTQVRERHRSEIHFILRNWFGS